MHQSIPGAPRSLSPPPPPLPRATAWHLPGLLVPGVGHLQTLLCPGVGHLQTLPYPGDRHLPTLGLFPTFWHACRFLSEFNYEEDFTRKTSILAPLSRIGKNWRGLLRHVVDFMHAFLHCLSSQNYIAKSGAIDVTWQCFLVKLNQISVDIIWRRTSFHIYKTIRHNR